jgi:hypothetical protein
MFKLGHATFMQTSMFCTTLFFTRTSAYPSFIFSGFGLSVDLEAAPILIIYKLNEPTLMEII